MSLLGDWIVFSLCLIGFVGYLVYALFEEIKEKAERGAKKLTPGENKKIRQGEYTTMTTDKVSSALFLWTCFFMMVGIITVIIGKPLVAMLAFASALVTSVLSWILRKENGDFENGIST